MRHFPTRFKSDDDGWSAEHARITSEESVKSIQEALARGPVIVELWFYRGSAAPERRVFDNWADLENYLHGTAHAGDAVDVWSFEDLCTPELRVAYGKCPGADGTVPERGAY